MATTSAPAPHLRDVPAPDPASAAFGERVLAVSMPAGEPTPADGAEGSVGMRARAIEMTSALAVGALTAFCAFRAGGFFPSIFGPIGVLLALALAVRATTHRRPFAALSATSLLVALALAGLSVWTLASAGWSHTPGRATLEFDRTVLYALVFVAFGSLSWTPARIAWAVRGLLAALFAVMLLGLMSRVLPDVITIGAQVGDRLSFPATYWNTMGLLGALALPLALHMSASSRERPLAQALGAASLPVILAAQFLTFSRGGLLAAGVAVVVYVVVCRTRTLVTALVAVLPVSVFAVWVTWQAEALARQDVPAAEILRQGHMVFEGVLVATGLAFFGRLACSRWLDPRLLDITVLPARARRVKRTLAGAAVLVVLVAAVGLDAPGRVQGLWEGFAGSSGTTTTDQRDRILQPGNNGRLDHWRVALEMFGREPLHGTGAGTFQVWWAQKRDIYLDVVDAHSLYLEVLGELGIVGIALLLLVVGGIVGGFAWRIARRWGSRSVDPSIDAAILAVLVAWAVRAGLDWDWEMPAVTIPFFALGAMGLALRGAPPEDAVASAAVAGAGAGAGAGTDTAPPTHEHRSAAARLGALRQPRPVSAGPGGLDRRLRVAIGLGFVVLAVAPWQAMRSQLALNDAVSAFRGSPQNCSQTIRSSLDSLAAVGSRPEPWVLIAFCDVGLYQPQLAQAAAAKAVKRDPLNWEFHYSQALVQAATGQDPLPAARMAVDLNPKSALALGGVEKLSAAKSPAARAAVARTLPLP